MSDLYCTIDEALDEFRAGKPLVLRDEPDREDEGDLIVPAQSVTAETINMMLREGRGLLTVPMEQARLEELQIELVKPRNADEVCPRFAVPVDAVSIQSTGISASDRAATIVALIDPASTADDFVIPGHIFPLAEHPEGLRGRRGHTEGSLALARLAGLYPAIAMSEILRDDGEMAKAPDLEAFAERLNVRIVMMDAIAGAAGVAP